MNTRQLFAANDRFAQFLGVELLEVSPGRAKAKLAIMERQR